MAATEGTFAESVKLTGSANYSAWKFREKSILQREDLWELVIVAENDDGEVMEVHIADAANLARRKQRASNGYQLSVRQ